jgi:ABC-type transporter Mla subunit MlaD
MRLSNEMKTGAVVVAALAIAAMFFLKTANFQTSKYDIKTYFTYAGDLTTNAVVKLAGIEVGRLKEIKFIYGPETKVECVIELGQNTKVRTDSIAYISTSGIVGDSYVGLTAGKSSEFVKQGDVIVSEDPVQMRNLMKIGENIAENLDKTLAEVKTLVVDNKDSLDNIIVNLEAVTENFKEFSEDVKNHPWKLLFKGE